MISRRVLAFLVTVLLAIAIVGCPSRDATSTAPATLQIQTFPLAMSPSPTLWTAGVYG
ncbi:MAG: hypothetical protein ACE5JL_01020 [Dehalococcoidia bacterium]